MSHLATRRDEAERAIEAVVDGARAEDLETDSLDFKEEKGTVDPRTGRRSPIDPRDQEAAAALAVEAACMANTLSGGTLVVGVVNAVPGPDAFTGAYLDTAWLRERVWELTTPHLSLDVFVERQIAGKRIYLIDVPPNVAEIYVNGRIRTRHGARCVEPGPAELQRLLEERRGYDWTAEPSGLRFSNAEPRALASVRQRYAATHGTAPSSDLEIARRMGVVLDARDRDPELKRAGAILLAPFEPGVEQLVLLITTNESSPSRLSVRGPAPLLPLFDRALQLLNEQAFPGESDIVARQRWLLRPVPQPAYEEALVNALIHRDFRQERAAVNAWGIGDPAQTFKVRSPGGFPPGVRADRLIATPHRPRNPAIAHAFRVLGLGEAEGVGIGRMFHQMLRDGHPEPAILEEAGDVVVLLRGGKPDHVLRAYLDDLAKRDPRFEGDVRATITITQLLRQPVLRSEGLAHAAQCTPAEAFELLEHLGHLEVVSRLRDGTRSFRLSDRTRRILHSRVRYRTRRKLEDHWDEIEALLDTWSEISVHDVEKALDLNHQYAGRLVRTLVNDGHLKVVSKHSRGRGVRYARAG